MPIGIIDFLKGIQVQEQNADQLLIAIGLFHVVTQLDHEHRPVVYPGKVVIIRLFSHRFTAGAGLFVAPVQPA